eukprot:TRINITY_DN17518_c0_g1_i1.p1 TRINITY_DN17518_c0_g1~~TRINITY_DN17518_c0_g1_i1.p1  ORF type:complete len:348 (+),score=81.31 TRINITY_DN17518_c0_g1_i1:46-1089(+)
MRSFVWAFAAALCLSVVLCIPVSESTPKTESPLKFRADGTFKIVQFTDTHYTNGALSLCDDITPEERPCSGLNTTALMGAILDIEKPDLVVFTGDILTGGCLNPDRSYEEVLSPMTSRRIKWASTYGNHDDESGLNREQLIAKDSSYYPLSLTQRGPREIHGVSNYALTIEKSNSADAGYILYFLDSNAYDSSGTGLGGYDWIHTDQISWYQQLSNGFKNLYGKTLPALAFFHIPLIEYNDVWEDCTKHECNGNKYEGVYAANINSGFYAAALDQGDVKAMFVGHDHVNDYCGNFYGIKLCYGRATGYTTYGMKGFPRGARVIEIKEDGTINQYIRLPNGVIPSASN